MQFYFFTTAFSAVNAGSATNPASIDISFLPIILAGYGLILVVGLINAIFSVIAAIQAFQGKPYHYPLLGWLAA